MMTGTDQLTVSLGSTDALGAVPAAKGGRGSFAQKAISLAIALLAVLSGVGGYWIYTITAQPTTALAVSGGGLALVLMLLGIRVARRSRQRSWRQQLADEKAERERIEMRLNRHLIEQERREEKWRVERVQLVEQAATLSRTNANLQEELDRRKQAEKAYSMQRQDLVRSKDVLQLHVQARAEEMEKMQRRYELILDSAGEGICGLNNQGKIAFANPAAARIMGGTVERMIGRPLHDFFPTLPEVPANETENGQRPEVSINRLDGSNFVLEYSRSPIREGERAVGEVLLFKDITERKETEQTLARKAAELARSNAELEQFAFVASHDLQEPLRKILAFGDRLKAKCDAASLGEGVQYLDRMQNAAARMRNLIDDLLTFSRVISRTEPFAKVDLGQVVREVLGDLEVRIEKTGAKVTVGELPTIEADPMQMRQLFQNIIGNALKFHEPGAKPVVKISAREFEGNMGGGTSAGIKPGATGSDPAVTGTVCELIVQDNGIGFEEKYLDRIFAVFQRLHGRQEYEGTGIGLAVCRRIVERHQGTITARSKPGEGATFVMTLPLVHSNPITTS